jgi:hypothetical protein
MAKIMKKAADGYTSYGSKAGTPSPVTDYAGKTSKPDSYTQYKKGGVVKKAKQAATAIAMKKAGKAPKKMMKSGGTVSMQLGSYTRTIGKNYSGKAKMGKSMGKCKYGC